MSDSESEVPEVPDNLKVGDRIVGTDYFVSQNRYPIIKLTLEVVCERIKRWCNIDCCSDYEKLLEHWNLQEGIPNRDRTILLADNSVSSKYKVYSKRRQTVEQKMINIQNGYKKNSITVQGKKSSHYVESSAIGAFFESRNKSKKLEDLFSQLEFLSVFDGLYADLIVRIKGSEKWKMIQIKSSSWVIGKYAPYLCVNKRKYKDDIFIICIAIDEVEKNVPDHPDDLFKCVMKEILFMGNVSNLDKLNVRPYYKTLHDNLRVCFYEEDPKIQEKYKIQPHNPLEKYELLMENFVNYVKDEKNQFTYEEIMYDFNKINHIPESCITEKQGFKMLENILKNSKYTLTAPYRQNETVDFIIWKNKEEYLGISAKTISTRDSFAKGKALNKHLCDYVFIFKKFAEVFKINILPSKEVYESKPTTYSIDKDKYIFKEFIENKEEIIQHLDNLFSNKYNIV